MVWKYGVVPIPRTPGNSESSDVKSQIIRVPLSPLPTTYSSHPTEIPSFERHIQKLQKVLRHPYSTKLTPL